MDDFPGAALNGSLVEELPDNTPSIVPKREKKVSLTSKINEKSYVVLTSTIAAGLAAASLLMSVVLLFSFNGVAKGMMAAYAIDAQGNRVKLSQIEDPKKQAQHIQDFANWVTISLHSYRWYIPSADGVKKPDVGVSVSSGAKLPTAVWLGTLALDPNFAVEYRPRLAALLKQKGITADARSESVFVPTGKPSMPIKAGSGRYEVYVKGVQVNRSEGGTEKNVDRIKILTIAEVPAVSQATANKSYADKGLADAYAEARSWGLQVISIRDGGTGGK
jgi:hypothetical protein